MLELRLADIPSVGTTDNEQQFDWCIFKCVLKTYCAPISLQAWCLPGPMVL